MANHCRNISGDVQVFVRSVGRLCSTFIIARERAWLVSPKSRPGVGKSLVYHIYRIFINQLAIFSPVSLCVKMSEGLAPSGLPGFF